MESLSLNKFEHYEKPKYRLMITRHAERLPSGQLRPEGVEHSRAKGRKVKESGAEVLKAYASDHPSKRAYDTGDLISNESGIRSPLTGEQYKTREVPDIQYDILKPDLYHLVAEAKDRIEVATLTELGMSTERNDKGKLKIDMEKLPEEEQQRIAPVRQKNQAVGFEYVLANQEAVHRMAMGLAHQLKKELVILNKYAGRRQKAGNPPKGDVDLNNNSHGLFTESLLMETGVYVSKDGQEIQGVRDFNSSDFGGYFEPAESLSLVLDDPSSVPERIPVEFERADRVVNGKIYIDRAKLEALDRDYKVWKKSPEREKWEKLQAAAKAKK
jgi:hypothetical protein